jgi:hypothetical protein
MCQRSSGSAFMVGARFTNDTLQFTKGRPKVYRSSDIAERGFCAECGSQLYYRLVVQISGYEPGIALATGTLDDPESVKPEYHYGVESQLSWLHFDDGLPREHCEGSDRLADAYAAAGKAKK